MSIPEPVRKPIEDILDGWKRQLEAYEKRLTERQNDLRDLNERIVKLRQVITETEEWFKSG